MINDKNEIKSLIDDLNERKKELDCLYNVNQVLSNYDSPLYEVFQTIIDFIPAAWQFPDICKVQILYDDGIYKANGLLITELKQTANIRVDNQKVGEIQLYYIKPVKLGGKPIFNIEEQRLLNTIANELGQYLTLSKFRNLLQANRDVSSKLNISIELSNWLTTLHLTEKEMEQLCKSKICFKKGESIFKQTAFSSYVIIHSKGFIKAYVEDINDRSFIFKVIKPCDFIGLSTLFGDGHYGFSASALTHSEGYLVEKPTIMKIMEENRKFNFELMKWNNLNLQLMYKKMNFLANKQALGKVANTLLYLSKNVFDSKLIDSTVSRKNLAELSGISTENTVRILSELKNDGIIKISKNGIEIVHFELLKTFSIAG